MTLKEIRKMYHITRSTIAIMNGCSTMIPRYLETKSIRDLTFEDLEMYSGVIGIDMDTMLGLLFDKEVHESDLKSAFWEFHISRGLNVKKTWKSLLECSNCCTLQTLQTYAKEQDKFAKLKLNWCWFKLTGEELK